MKRKRTQQNCEKIIFAFNKIWFISFTAVNCIFEIVFIVNNALVLPQNFAHKINMPICFGYGMGLWICYILQWQCSICDGARRLLLFNQFHKRHLHTHTHTHRTHPSEFKVKESVQGHSQRLYERKIRLAVCSHLSYTKIGCPVR